MRQSGRMFRAFVCALVMMAANFALAGTTALQNQLVDHPSPYLAMHAEDPVHWQVWNRETLQKARQLNRPLLVSIGYFSCHWCHVMQRESYQDPLLAKLLNDYFVPVKIDRELAPALDAHLIEFVQLTRGQAGWPLNVFLTPDGFPLLGMTYVPPDRFRQTLEGLRDGWRQDSAQLRQMGQEAMDQWRQIRNSKTDKKPAKVSAVHGMIAQTDQLKDELGGGFGQQNKFPMVPQLRALLWLREKQDYQSQDGFIRLTLDRMANQGMHDELGGGFFRYVTDPDWQVPHYEKMLYDNAQLAQLYLQAAGQFQSSYYRDIGLSTLDFLLREMHRGDGYFISSFSAVDEQGREGFYYLWDEAELEKVLNAGQLKAVRAAWLGKQTAPSEYGKLPLWQGTHEAVAESLGWSTTRLNETLAAARKTLLDSRSSRSLLADDKGLAAWNGLALSALAAGYAATGDARYGKPADRLATYISESLWDADHLVRARDGKRVIADATLEDYALVAQGLWDWSQQNPQEKKRYQTLVEQMVRIAWQRYYRNRRWMQSDTPLIPMLDGVVALDDSPLPSATANVTRLSRQHPALRKDAELQNSVDAHLEQVGAYLGNSMFWYASYVELLETD
ncbi:MAG: thioredoxin domain-containing protein [Thiogranum sp.]